MLSVVDLSVELVKRLNGYVVGRLRRTPFMNGVFVGAVPSLADTSTVSVLYNELRRTNPVYSVFRPSFEWTLTAIASLPSTVLERLAQVIDRSPITTFDIATRATISTLMEACVTYADQISTSTHTLGRVFLRREVVARPLVHNDDGCAPAPFLCTIESLVFPFLFPRNKGMFIRNTRWTISAYMRYRLCCMFSLFTLYPAYVLSMYQVYTAMRLKETVRWATVSTAVKNKEPEETLEEVFTALSKHVIPSDLPGYPAYFSKQLHNLLAFCHNFGMPTLFLTLTMDDISRYKWQPVLEAEAYLNSFNQSFDYADAPVEMCHLFKQRLDDFMSNFVLGGDGNASIFGRILHHVIRIEFQGRGSPHAHIILWVHPDDRRETLRDIVAYIPADYDPVTQSFVEPLDDAQKELYHLVINKQQHPCCAPGRGCRSGEHGERSRCKYQYPHPPHEGETAPNPDTGRYVYTRPYVPKDNTPNAPSVNHRTVAYTPMCLLLWKANCMVMGVSQTDVCFYILKYTTKLEPLIALRIDAPLARTLGVELDEIALKFISSTVVARPVLTNEAAWIMLGFELMSFSDVIVPIYVSTPQARAVRAASRSQSEVFFQHIDSYMARPLDFESLTFHEYFTLYRVVTAPKTVVAKSFVFVGCDNIDGRVFKVPSSYHVRFTDANPAFRPEEFFYSVLLRKYPIRHEQELLTGGNLSYFDECFNRRLFTDSDTLVDLIQPWIKYNMKSEADCSMIVETLLTEHHIPDDSAADNGMLPNPVLPPPAPPLPLAAEFAHLDCITLTDEQAVVFNVLSNKRNGLFVIQGVPGSGKSLLLRKLIRHYDAANLRLSLNGSTGAAAKNLSTRATTVHSGYVFPNRGAMLPDLHPLSDAYPRLHHTDIHIIDELSMLSSVSFGIVMKRLCQVLQSPHPEAVLSQTMIILCGDLYQLPPVCHHRTNESSVCALCIICSSCWWARATHFNLSHSVRQAGDMPFVRFLGVARTATPSDELIREVFGPSELVPSGCYINEQEALRLLTNTPGARVLCTHRKDCVTYNTHILDTTLLDSPLILITPHHTRTGATDESVEVPEKWLTDPEFHQLNAVRVGCLVMILKNVCQKRGLTNGTIGTVTGVLHLNDTVHTVVLSVPGVSRPVHIRRTVTAYMLVRGALGDTTFGKRTFPLTLAYAATAHKAQGSTLDTLTIVHIRDIFSPGQLYVMLSRVTTRLHLRIVGELQKEQFVPVVLPAT